MRGLDRKIDIERKTVTQDPYGQEVEAWAKLCVRRSASYRPVSGDERFISQQFVAKQQVEFRIRFSSDVANINPLDRVIYPATTTEDEMAPQIYDIMQVTELGRREALSIMAARRTEENA